MKLCGIINELCSWCDRIYNVSKEFISSFKTVLSQSICPHVLSKYCQMLVNNYVFFLLATFSLIYFLASQIL